jgi:SPP1 gp7 family putative phage head morphogenesis protein
MLADSSRILVRDAASKQAKIIGSCLPKGSDLRRSVEREAQLPNRQLDAIIKRSTQQITSTLIPLSGEATEAVLDQLIIGATRGQNPRRVAAQMIQQVEGAFNGGLSRAINVARTEGLDAHRAAAAVAQNQHGDVLAGWQWLSTLGSRTCPACWGMHGSKHPADERGPDGHQQCRCSRAPLTKSWRDLGFDIPEPPSLIRDGQREFQRLPRRQQLEVMGPTRLRALESGRAVWDELAQVRHNDGWRDAVYMRPVADFRNRLGRTA